MKRKNQDAGILLRILLFLYSLIMLYLLFFRSFSRIDGLSYQEQIRSNCNLHPFYTIGNYIHVVLHGTSPHLIRHCFVNLFGNVLLFVPAGILLPAIYKKQQNFFRFLLTCPGTILTVETIQLFTLLGIFDIDDIILNLIGMILGFFLWKLFHIIRK